LAGATNRRRHVLSELDIGDVTLVEQGLTATVRQDKTDQQAEGSTVAVPYGSNPLTCPVRRTLAWIALMADRGITGGPLLRAVDRHGVIAGQPGAAWAGRPPGPGFRMNPGSINRAVQAAGHRAQLPPEILEALSAHSLRAGGATGAYLGGADLLSIARHGGWTDGSSALYRYIRGVDPWTKNPMYKAGL
jgi:integrase